MRVIAIGLVGLLTLAGLLGPLPTSAQVPEKIPHIGVLALGAADSPTCKRTDPLWEAFEHGLRDLGYIEGQNMRIEYRCGDFQHEQLLARAAELVRLPVDVLVTAGPGALAAKQADTTVPIVFAIFADPLGEGLVANLARPGGNVTGQSLMGTDLAAKRLGLPHGAGARTPAACRPLESGSALVCQPNPRDPHRVGEQRGALWVSIRRPIDDGTRTSTGCHERRMGDARHDGRGAADRRHAARHHQRDADL